TGLGIYLLQLQSTLEPLFRFLLFADGFLSSLFGGNRKGNGFEILEAELHLSAPQFNLLTSQLQGAACSPADQPGMTKTLLTYLIQNPAYSSAEVFPGDSTPVKAGKCSN